MQADLLEVGTETTSFQHAICNGLEIRLGFASTCALSLRIATRSDDYSSIIHVFSLFRRILHVAVDPENLIFPIQLHTKSL